MKQFLVVFAIIIAIVAVNILADKRDQKLMANHYCHTTKSNGEVIAWQC